MSDLTNLDDSIAKIKRFINKTVVSGTFSDVELKYYIMDANDIVAMDIPEFGTYVVTTGTGISPTPTATDMTLLSLQASILVYTAILQETVADAVMVKAGSITLDTSRSLKGISDALNSLKSKYTGLIDTIILNGTTGSSSGARIDVYAETINDVENPDSLI